MILRLFTAVTTGAAVLAVSAAALAAPPAKPQPAKAQPPKIEMPAIQPKSESACGIMVSGGDKQPAVYKEVAGLKLLGGPDAIALPKTDVKPLAIRCARDTVVPGKGDGRVIIELGLPLSITDGDRTLRVQLSAPKKGEATHYVYGMVQGKLTDPEKQAVAAQLRIMTINLQAFARHQAQLKADAKAKADGAPISTKK
jgi:hypothetical protein